jgi:DNA-binding PadR family transcriptional regulator
MVAAKTAVLLALRQGPAYGRELVRRIKHATGGRLHLSEGTIHPALRALRAARLVSAWSVIPGRTRGGRARTYYELTIEGVREAEAQAHALVEFADAAPRLTRSSPTTSGQMRHRAERVAELSRAVAALRDSLPPERRRA